MIASVRGRVTALNIDSAVVEVGGLGFQVMCTPSALAELRLGSEAAFATSLVVREDSMTLFGFPEVEERALFELLQTASGVGPKLAQAMLAVHGPDDLRRAVLSEDLVTLCKVSGIGRKGAQRIVLELKDRIGAPTSTALATRRQSPAGGAQWQDTVRAGLLGLGWNAREADAAIDVVTPIAQDAAESGQPMTTAALLRTALRSLSRA